MRARLDALSADAVSPALVALNNAHAEELTLVSSDALSRLIRRAFLALCCRTAGERLDNRTVPLADGSPTAKEIKDLW